MDIDKLFEESDWMPLLARSLVRDQATADDISQQTWLAAVEQSPRPSSTGPWLRKVVSNFAKRSYREQSRRTKREKSVARPEAQNSTAEQLLERAEMQKALAQAVLDLKDPYRSVILMRFFDDLPPKEIASQLKIPIATVWTQLSRALEQLKTKLDKDYGKRASWQAVLIPWFNLPSPMPAAAPNADANIGDSGIGQSVFGETAATGVGVGLIRDAVIACLFIGLSYLAGTYASITPEKTKKLKQLNQIESQKRQVENAKEMDSLALQMESIEKQNAELNGALTQAKQKMIELKALQLSSSKEKFEAVFSNKEHSQLLAKLQWTKLAEAMFETQSKLHKIIEASLAEEESISDLQAEAGLANSKVVTELYPIIGKIPTLARHNGELTHPLILSNVYAALFESRSCALSMEQIAHISESIQVYENEIGQAEVSEIKLTALLHEHSKRFEFIQGLREQLTEEQRELISQPLAQDQFMVDVFSPATSLVRTANLLGAKSVTRMRAVLHNEMRSKLHLSEAQIEYLAKDIDEYWHQASKLLVQTNSYYAPIPLEDAISLGYTFEALAQQCLKLPDLSNKSREILHDLQSWPLPAYSK